MVGKDIAFFDFDGTITDSDSLFVFLKTLVGKKIFYIGMIKNLHYLLGYLFGYINNEDAKKRVVAYFLEGMQENKLLQKSEFAVVDIEQTIRRDALSRIRWHKSRGDKVVIVSATFSCYLDLLANKLDVECIATELEIKDGVVTGRFATPNCYGIEKRNRILKKYDLKEYQEVYAYGDSRGDIEMLELATQRFYKYFKKNRRSK